MNFSEKYNFALADPMNYGLLKEKAEYNRQHPTDAERVFWRMLKSELPSIRFRNQYIIGNYIVDFVALKLRLVIEIDGEYHFDNEQETKDLEREAYLKTAGFRVIRFTNQEVLTQPDIVIRSLKTEV